MGLTTCFPRVTSKMPRTLLINRSHFGGVWERLIRSVRGILEVTLGKQVVSDDCLVTLFCEAEAVINSRPISVVSMDSRDPAPLTPNMLLTLGDSPVVVGNFGEGDSYSRKRWRQVPYMSDQFWRRWKEEYMVNLQQRQKWTARRRKISEGDIVGGGGGSLGGGGVRTG